ncbi:fibronectin type III domain-containing protein 1 isoform X2 [Anolis carolinensis]|uniref:fibronectin type III domain-containing protein 1 isoform X2 n=1 Tax=Anolis carolinensis TaxID=28377 RepID=UPI002F2B5AFF
MDASALVPRGAGLSSWAALGLLALLIHLASPAAPEKDVPSRPLRFRARSSPSSPDRSPLRWRLPQYSGSRIPGRYPGYLSRYGESSRKMSYKPLPKERSHDIKKPEDELEEVKDVTVRVMSSQSVLVTWTDPVYEKQRRAATPRQYAVRYREKGESARWDYKQIHNRRVLVDKLIPDTMYEFAVQISQGETEGKWSASVYQRTPESAPTNAPENLNVWPIKGETPSVAATWDALSESEGKVKEYILSYAPALKPFGAKSISYPGDTTSALVDGLQPGERYIFKIRAANRRGQGPQSKAFSVVLPTDGAKVDQQTNIEEDSEPRTSGNTVASSSFQTSSSSETLSPGSSSKDTSGHPSSFPGSRDSKVSISDLKNKILAGNRALTKSQPSSGKGAAVKTDARSSKGTADHDSVQETSTVHPRIQDMKSGVKSHSPLKPSQTISSLEKIPLRSRTPVRTGKTTKSSSSSPQSSSSSSIPKYTENETKNIGQNRSNVPSSSEATLDSLPVDNESNDRVDSAEEKAVVIPKTPGNSHLRSNHQPSASRKVVHSRPTKLNTNSNHPSYQLVPSDTTETLEIYKNIETEKREQKPGSKPVSPQGGSSTSVNTKPLSHSSRQRDPRIATSAVSAAVTHTLPHSYGSSSAKRKPNGRYDSNDNDRDNSERDEDEENRRGSSFSRPITRTSSSQAVSERFDLSKYRSAHTINRFANQASNTRTQSSKDVSTTQSSKVHPQSNSQLTSGRTNSNIDKELETEDEKPLPSTLPHGHSPSFSKPSVDYSRKKVPLVESGNHHRIVTADNSSPIPTQEETYSEGKEATDRDSSHKNSGGLSLVPGQSASLSRHRSTVSHQLTNGQSSRSRGASRFTESVSRTSVERSSPLRTPASKYQSNDLESKDKSPQAKLSSPLSKATLTGGSHALSRKTLQPENSHSSKTLTDQSQSQYSRSHPALTSLQSQEKIEDDGNSEEKYYKETINKKEQENPHSVATKEVFPSRRTSTILSQGSTSALSKHSDSHMSKSGERSSSQRESSPSSKRLSLSPGKPSGSKIISSSEDISDVYKLHASSHQSKYSQPSPASSKDTIRDHTYNRERSPLSKVSSASQKEIHPSMHHYPSRSKVPTRTESQTDKKYGLIEPTSTKIELSPKESSSKTQQSLSSNNNEDDSDQSETEENPTSSSSAARWRSSSVSRGSKNLNNFANGKSKSPSPVSTHKTKFANKEEYEEEEVKEDEENPISKTSNVAPLDRIPFLTSRASQTSKKPHALPHSSRSTSVFSHIHPTHSASPTHSSVSASASSNQPIQNSRLSNPSQRQQLRFPHRQGNGGRPNLTTKQDLNNKITPGNNGKRNGQKIINGPQGIKWVVDLDRGLVLNIEGRYLQDSQGKPLRVKLGGDGRTIVDSKGAPIVSPEGLPLFGHGRFSKPVANAQDKPIISLGGKPLIGLEMVKRTTPPITTTTTTTTTAPTTTTPEPTTTEPPTEKPLPTCPPGTYPEYNDVGDLVLGHDDLPQCNIEDTFSGLDADVTGTTESYVVYDEDYEFFETTLPPSTTIIATTTEALPETIFPEFSVTGTDPLSEYDAAGRKRFTAPYVTYLNKDPGAPCSLTEALDHFQVESLDEIIPNDLKNTEMRPQKAPHNITIVAVEGCHSFVILDWAKPMHGDMVTGYLVYSASYDDFIRNKWSTKSSGNTNLPIENLKPNTRYYFRVQAKNPFGFGPVSSSISYVTESDNPLLIVRPPGGEPIWIPFSFKYDPTYSECSGKQYVKRTWYRKFVGVVLCNSLRYKIYLSDDLRDTFYSIGDSWGRGEDHCQFVDSHLDGRTGPQSYVEALPPIQGYYRQYRQEPVSFGRIGYMTPYYYVGWYECGVPIPGKW